MKMVVQFGVDACLPCPDTSAAMMSVTDALYFEHPRNIYSNDDIASHQYPPCWGASPASSPGRASRSVHYLDRLDWNELYSQMALSQTPTLRLGVREWEEFTEMREWQLEGPGSPVDAGTTSRRRVIQRGADILDHLVQRRERPY